MKMKNLDKIKTGDKAYREQPAYDKEKFKG